MVDVRFLRVLNDEGRTCGLDVEGSSRHFDKQAEPTGDDS